MRHNTSIVLLPCPFCGGLPVWSEGEQKMLYGNEQVYCTSCFALAAPESNKHSAAERWNQRANRESVTDKQAPPQAWIRPGWKYYAEASSAYIHGHICYVREDLVATAKAMSSGKETPTEQKIRRCVNAALRKGNKVTVDGVRVRGIRFHASEIEVEWDAEGEIDEDVRWTVIQPNYLHEFENGELELKTY